MHDLTVILVPSEWNDESLSRSIESVARLMLESGLKVQCLIAEFLPNGTDVNRLREKEIELFPTSVQQCLDREGFDYVVEYGSTARGLRRAVRCAKGRYVSLLREGDSIGFRRTAANRLNADLDVIVALSIHSKWSLSVHQRILAKPADCRALPSLVSVTTAYEAALLLKRDFLDDVLGLVRYDAERGYFGYLNEIVSLALLRDSGRVGFTEQFAVLPVAQHAEIHRRRVCEYVLPVLQARRKEMGGKHEDGTEAVIDALLQRLIGNFSAGAVSAGSLAQATNVQQWQEGALGAPLASMVDWLSSMILLAWGWMPGQRPPLARIPDKPDLPQRTMQPKISFVTSAFRGQHVMFGFFSNLLQQTIADQSEVLVVTPVPNLVQELVGEYFAWSTPQVRLMPLDQDPGIYNCWNIAIKASRGVFISNANLDDRRDRRHVGRLMSVFESSEADVASTAVAITRELSELIAFEGDIGRLDAKDRGHREIWYGDQDDAPKSKGLNDFFVFDSSGHITQCMNFPHCMPVWRRSVHDRFGFFDEERNGTYADFALWLRGVSTGLKFVHVPTPLGLYFVDPASHNRRNADEVTWERIVKEAVRADLGLQLPAHVKHVPDQPPAQPKSAPSARTPDLLKVDFAKQISQNYGKHRSGWAYALQGLDAFHDPQSEVYCDAFIEKRFVWGSDPGDGGVGPPAPHLRPWIGFIHVPPLVPSWFQFEQSNEQIFSKPAWKQSLPYCRGLFTLSEYHRKYLLNVLRPDFPISVLYHPTEFPEVQFDFERYLENPDKRLIQVGWWLRKLTAIDRQLVPDHKPTLLGASDWSKNLLTYAERRCNGLRRPGKADVIDFLDNDAYDKIIAANIVFIDFYDTSANNAVIECVARGTPIIVCKHPAVVEYLGADYPLYFDRPEDVYGLVKDKGRLRAACTHLANSELKKVMTLDRFVADFRGSEVLKNAHS